MAPLFTDRSDLKLRLALAALVAFAAGAPIGAMIYLRVPDGTAEGIPLEQPVEFDHRHHVRDDGIACLYCHSGAERSAVAGVPPAELCMGCHNQVWNGSRLLEPVRAAYFSGQPIRWNRVHDLPDHVYFNHAIHVGKGFTCEACHGRVDLMPRVYKVAPLTMGWCIGCHRDPEGRSDPPAPPDSLRHLVHCSTCHR